SYSGSGGGQTIANLPYGNLTLSGTGTKTLAANTTVTGTLALGSSVLTTGANAVILPTGAALTRTSGFVNGKLQKAIATTTTTLLYEVGTGTTYAPVSVSFTGSNGSGTLTASSTVSQHPNYGTSGLSSTQYVNRYWTLSPGGGLTATTYSAIFTFAASDLIGSPNTSILRVRRWISPTWTAPTSTTSTSTTATAAFATSFGDYAIGI